MCKKNWHRHEFSILVSKLWTNNEPSIIIPTSNVSRIPWFASIIAFVSSWSSLVSALFFCCCCWWRLNWKGRSRNFPLWRPVGLFESPLSSLDVWDCCGDDGFFSIVVFPSVELFRTIPRRSWMSCSNACAVKWRSSSINLKTLSISRLHDFVGCPSSSVVVGGRIFFFVRGGDDWLGIFFSLLLPLLLWMLPLVLVLCDCVYFGVWYWTIVL